MLTWLTSLQVLCACSALLAMPAAAFGAAEQATSPAAIATPASAATPATTDNGNVQVGSVSLDRRVLTLLVMGCVVGMILGWVGGGPRETRLRLLKKAKNTHLAVLVPAGPAPRLIPSDSPNAIRARRTRAPVSRQTPTPTQPRRDASETTDHRETSAEGCEPAHLARAVMD
jgi:hypothetical protein